MLKEGKGRNDNVIALCIASVGSIECSMVVLVVVVYESDNKFRGDYCDFLVIVVLSKNVVDSVESWTRTNYLQNN